jgi:hypothetical protein
MHNTTQHNTTHIINPHKRKSTKFEPDAASLHDYPVTVLSGPWVRMAGNVFLLCSLRYGFEDHGSKFHSVYQISVYSAVQQRGNERKRR